MSIHVVICVRIIASSHYYALPLAQSRSAEQSRFSWISLPFTWVHRLIISIFFVLRPPLEFRSPATGLLSRWRSVLSSVVTSSMGAEISCTNENSPGLPMWCLGRGQVKDTLPPTLQLVVGDQVGSRRCLSMDQKQKVRYAMIELIS